MATLFGDLHLANDARSGVCCRHVRLPREARLPRLIPPAARQMRAEASQGIGKEDALRWAQFGHVLGSRG